jgi:O-antigen/teichoic acid export membrane protein
MTSAAWLLVWRTFSRSIGLISTLILARVLLPRDFGIVAMATTFSTIIDALSQIGVQDALVRRTDNDERLLDTAFTLQVARGLFTAILVAASGPAASWWFGEPRLVYMMLALAITLLITSFENVGIAEFRRSMRYRLVFLIFTIPRLASVIVTISMALLLKSYWALLIGGAASAIVRTAVSYVFHPYRPQFDLSRWRTLAGFSFWIWASCVVGILWDRIDVFVIGPKFGSVLLGAYVIALELACLPMTELVAPVSEALFAGFSRAQSGDSGSARHAPLVATMLVMVIMPITITISCASGYIVAALLGPHWVSAIPLVSILAWLCIFSPLSSVCNTVLIANGFVSSAFLSKAIATAVKVTVLLIATSIFKRLDLIAGVMTGCVAIESCAYLVFLQGLKDVRLPSMLLPMSRILLAGGLVVLVLWQFGLAWQPITMPSPKAFLYSAGAGLIVVSLFSSFLLALWWMSGLPAGPETRLFELVRNFLRPLFMRIVR